MKRSRAFTLIEMMLVVASMMVIMSMCGAFFSQGWIASLRSVRRIHTHQQIPIIMKGWRNGMRNSDASTWQTDGIELTGANLHVHQAENHLVIGRGNSQRHYLLPEGAICSFSIERQEDLNVCAVLTLSWTSKLMHRDESHMLRFVACGRNS